MAVKLKTKLAASARQAKAVDLVLLGWSYRKIAAELGYAGPGGVAKAIKGAICKAPSRSVNELRAEVDERARTMLAELWPLIRSKRASSEQRLAAMDRVIKIDRELRQLHGLDAPETAMVATASVSGATPAEARRVMSELFGSIGPIAAIALEEERARGAEAGTAGEGVESSQRVADDVLPVPARMDS